MFISKINSPPGAQDALLKQLIVQFEGKNSGVKVQYSTYNSPAEESSKIETSLASGSGPDVFEFGSTLVPTAAATGAFVVLTNADWAVLGGESKFFAAQLKMSGLKPNELIAVPEYMLPFALVYNTELLGAAGAKPPTTWTEFVDAAKKMTNASKGQYGTVMDPSDPFDPWHITWVLAKQLGGDFITEDLAKATMDSEPVYQAFRFWFDWMSKFDIANTADATFKGVDQLNKFASGDIGFLVMQGPTTIPTLDKSAVKGKYAFAPMPTVPYGMTSLPSGGVPVQTFVSGQYLTLAKYSSLKDDALLWLRYVTDVAQQMQFLKSYGYMPAITEAYKQPELQTPVWKAFVSAEDHAYATPLTGAWGPIETVVGGVASKIAAEYATKSYKTGDLKKALAATNGQIQSLLDAQKKS
ncbi:MAG: extracellular solute-binding protein [Chloroflexi bacterium]|nr:extracellular solute-binding protein [Chloroflexota bacterium]